MAAVTFSGFNNIDFNQVLTAIMAQESQPLTALQTQKTALATQDTQFGTLATKLAALKSATDALTGGASVSGVTASSSDPGVGVTSSSGTIEGTYDVVVTALARRQITASTSTYASTDAIVATGGTVTFTGGDGTETTVPLTGPTTIAGLADLINANGALPVTASLVQSSPGSYQLVLTGRETGADRAFTVQTALTGGDGVSFLDGDDDGISGNSATDNVQSARNAALTVNNLAISSATNTVTDVIPGATLTLGREAPDTVVTVTVGRDSSAATARINALITAYNGLMSFVGDQQTAAASGGANIARDPVVRELRNALRTTLMDEYTNGGAFAHLAEVGVGFDATGKMTLDSTLFTNAITTRTADVQALFTGDGGSGGAFGSLASLVSTYTKSGGLVADARSRIGQQSARLADRMDLLQMQLDRRKQSLQQEFAAADAAMTQLNSQAATLSSLAGQYRLF